MSVLMYALALFCPVMQMSELVHHEVTDQPDTNDQTFVDPSWLELCELHNYIVKKSNKLANHI